MLHNIAQLIYTRVEPDYSPVHKSGFQTVYKSASLSSSEAAQIEKRIQCFLPSQPKADRKQFFTLDSGTIVLTNTIQIDAHPEITDKSRRSGAFIVHCLVLERNEFDKVDYNPFAVFDQYNFLNNAEEMIEDFGQATGTAPLVKIPVSSIYLPDDCNWSGSETRKLVTLAVQANELSNKKQSVLLTGTEDNIENALRLAFFLAPKDQRLNCSFNTHIGRCSIQPGDYWAIGSTMRQGGNAYIQVNATERRVIGRVKDALDGSGLYLTWLKKASSEKNLSAIIEHAPTNQILSRAFTQQTRIPVEAVDEDACDNFMALHEEFVVRNLENVLAQVVGKNAAGSLANYLREISGTPYLLNIAASRYINPQELSSIVVDWIINKTPNLQKSDWKKLQDLARAGKQIRLLYMSATLGKKIDKKVRDEALCDMGRDTFHDALEQLLNPTDPVDFVTPQHLPLLLSDNRLDGMTEEQFIDLVGAILEIDAPDQLIALTQHVYRLESKMLAKLEKMTKKETRIPKKFTTAMQTQRRKLGPVRRFALF